ncbi:hypothetical protein A5671_21710 [Mycolicibacter heraklionensis]|nr:hypothetical protein A5671_21710 [Mycolicibacter heraklionensis]
MKELCQIDAEDSSWAIVPDHYRSAFADTTSRLSLLNSFNGNVDQSGLPAQVGFALSLVAPLSV